MTSSEILFENSTHSAFHALITDKYILRDPAGFESFSVELKYTLIRLSSLGVIEFASDRIQLVEGMEAWMKMYWSEISSTW